ncbi:MAG: biotin--[acetyl-CoA-carboxylase] ligase, partial [Nitrospinota bacterium]
MTPFAEEIRRHRATGRDVPIYAYAALDSTNEEAFRLADRESLPEGTAIIADAQTRGKGRTGRSWSSPPGAGLYLSGVYRPPGPAATAPPRTRVAGVAAAAARERLA